MRKITILGGGAWGSAIANITGANNYKTVLYSNEETSAREINFNHTNSKYIKFGLNNNVYGSTSLKDSLDSCDYIFVILPSKIVYDVLEEIKNLNINFKQNFVVFTKGIDKKTGKFFSELIYNFFPNAEVAVLSGPNFAEEVAEKRLTITTVATERLVFFKGLENVLNCNYFNIKYFNDCEAVQLCGLVKNVLAILCGISEGLDLGRNTFSAIICKGTMEIHKLCIAFNCNEKVINTPAGIGDIILTCSSLKSRNMSFGYRIGQGEKIKDIMNSLNSTVEGLLNAENLKFLSEKNHINNSIANTVLDIINNEYSKDELKNIIMKKLFE